MKIFEIESALISYDGDHLPPVLYHGTTLANAQKILKTGLRPEYSLDRGEYTKGYIFLSTRKEGAAAFAPGGSYSNSNEPGAIIEITNTPDLAKTIRTRLGEFIRCPSVILPELLKITEYTNRHN